MTNQEIRDHKREWSAGIAERRVVRFDQGTTFKCYPTIAMRDAAIVQAEIDGRDYRVVTVE